MTDTENHLNQRMFGIIGELAKTQEYQKRNEKSNEFFNILDDSLSGVLKEILFELNEIDADVMLLQRKALYSGGFADGLAAGIALGKRLTIGG